MRRGSLSRRLRWLVSQPWLVYAIGLCLFGFVRFLAWPIIAADNDLWYHLNTGRYILQHHAIPDHSYFSFVSPPRVWVDYYWLFQVGVYACYAQWQYYGLIALRALAFLATALGILWFLFRGQRGRTGRSWFAFIGIACVLILLPRNLLLRPHLCSYLFLLSFLAVLEFAPRRSLLLIPLGILWCNLHGVSYPILVLIASAYLAESLLLRRQPRAGRARADWGVRLSLLATLATPLLTPHGAQLLRMPFVSTVWASQYIKELQPLQLWDLLSFHLIIMTPTSQTVFNVLLIVILVTAVTALMRRTARISHLLLAVAGFALLFKGLRFVNECTLLALPLLRANPLLPSTRLTRRVPKLAYLVGVGLLLLLPLRMLLGFFSERPAYPFSYADLPQGVVAFLNRLPEGGTVLNHPNNGGYLQWMLYPRYSIFMDMEIPFLFTDEDMYIAQHVFTDDVALGKVVTRYHPTFLTVLHRYREFPKRLKPYPQYVPVFFDDEEILYVDRDQRPSVAAAYELKAVNPFEIAGGDIDRLLARADNREAVLAEMRRIVGVYPDCGSANQILAVASNDQKAYAQAITHAEAIIRAFPESPMGYRLKGDSLKGLKHDEAAIAAYEAAIERAAPEARASLYKEIGFLQLELHRDEQAYRTLKQSIEVFSPRTDREDLYRFGIAALRAGHRDEAKTVFLYLYEYQSSNDDAEWAKKLQKALADLGVDASR